MTLFFLGLAALSPSDERAIRKTLAALASAASVDPKQSVVLRQMQGTRLRDFFAQDVVLRHHDSTHDEELIQGRGELMQYLTTARATLHQATFRFTRIQIEVASNRTSATARSLLEGDLNGEANSMRSELMIVFKKLEHKWLLTEIESSASSNLPR